MKRILTYYPNCSLGGMSTVLRNRIYNNPDERHTLVFSRDAGGRESFRLANVDVRIVSESRVPNLISYALSAIKFDEVRLISAPQVGALLPPALDTKIVYEFHTSTSEIIDREVAEIDVAQIDEFYVPSDFTRKQVMAFLPSDLRSKVSVVPNLIDERIFAVSGPALVPFPEESCIPILWVGRLDKGKNPNDALRLLATLPLEFRICFVFSLESDPFRLESFLGLAAGLGVESRIATFLDLSPMVLSELKRGTRDAGGFFLSTSLAESFGYSVAEASQCGLPALGYNVGGLGEHTPRNAPITLVEVGNLERLQREALRYKDEQREPT